MSTKHEKTVLLIEPSALSRIDIIRLAVSDFLGLRVIMDSDWMINDASEMAELAVLLHPGSREIFAKVRNETAKRLWKRPFGVLLLEGEGAVAKLSEFVGASLIPIPGNANTLREAYGPNAVHCPTDATGAEKYIKYFFPLPSKK